MERDYTKKKSPSVNTMRVISDHYRELKQKLCTNVTAYYRGRDIEDVFSDTVVYVIHDKTLAGLSDTDILRLFQFRFNMIRYQIAMDCKTPESYLNENITADEADREG